MKKNLEENKQRLINFRKPFLVFIGLMIGIILSYNFCVNMLLGEPTWLYSLILVFVVVVFITSLIYIILGFKRSLNKRLSLISRLVILVLISVIVGLLFGFFATDLYAKSYVFSGTGEITAKVVDIEDYDYGKSYVIDNIVIKTDNEVVMLQGKSRLYVSNHLYFKSAYIGNTIRFEGKVSNNKVVVFDDFQKLINGYGFNIEFVDKSEGFSVIDSTQDIRFSIKDYIRTLIFDNMSDTNASIAYGMLFGDKSDLDNVVSNNFSISGVMHLLAVSGLHVGVISGVIIAIINFILRKFNITYLAKSITKVVVLSLFLLFYAYLCMFSASVCRASIMIIVYTLAKLAGFRYDTLSSLSIAGIIILLINPLTLFSIGFQLSFLCIFAIITLVPKMNKITDKWNIPRWLSSPLNSSIAINFVIFPILLNNFGSASILSIFANIIVIPLFSIIFPITFCLSFIVALFPFLGFLLFLPDIGIQIIRFVVEIFATIPFGVITTFRVGYIVFAIIIIFAFLAKYLMCKPKFKSIILISLICCEILFGVINTLPANYQGSNLIIRERYGEVECLFVVDNDVICLGKPSEYTKQFLFDLRIKNIDSLFLVDFSLTDLNDIKSLCTDYKIKRIVVNKDYQILNETIWNIDTNIHYNEDGLNFGGCRIDLIIDNEGNNLAIELKSKKFNFLYLLDSLTMPQYSFLGAYSDTIYDYVLLSKDIDISLADYDIISEKVICIENELIGDIVLGNINYCDIKL